MKSNNLFFAFFMLLSVVSFAQRNTGVNSNGGSNAILINDAKNFGLSIVKAYFDEQCPIVYGKIATEYVDFNSGAKVQKSSISQADFCANSPIMTDLGFKYSQYLNNYTPEILDHVQFGAKYPRLQALLQLKAGDVYFGGNILKAGASEIFHTPNAIRFVVRKNARGAFEITKL
jgi:hypothetical protein